MPKRCGRQLLRPCAARSTRLASLRIKIAAVACTGHGNGVYLVDAAGHPVRNAIFSADTRARAYVERWTAAGIDRAVRPKTMQALWPGQPNALLAWLADHEPELSGRTRWCLMCKDYTRMRLTGEAFAEQTDMSGTSLLDVGSRPIRCGTARRVRHPCLAREVAAAAAFVRRVRPSDARRPRLPRAWRPARR